MRQQINLFQPAIQHPKVPLSARTQMWVALVFMLSLVGLYVHQRWQVNSLEEHLVSLQDLRDEAQGRIEALSTRRVALNQDPTLALQIRDLRTELSHKQWALDQITALEGTPVDGFSVYLEGLARNRVAGVWLTGIRIRDDRRGLVLRGSARDAELVSELWLRLAAEPAFAEWELGSLRIEQPEQEPGHIDFVLEMKPMRS